ncbi:PRC-barrel domain-containing protein [Halomonas sp. SH5A2]|uniref:PRC-barrel domain-containing protein n=1 Tax=Halomonas sp. SH5A2 TaxID=2749040 RepID=UPI001641AE9C|nr:PRC-barrel domain-containing protein [Halomonas sp. SH5A2]QNI03055.1 PRC-barrel domain-containing protein [Halomonas sp. SH5A2]
MLKPFIAILISAATFLLFTTVHAEEQTNTGQQVDVSELQEYDNFVIQALGLSVERTEGMPVIGPNAEEVGAVEEVLVDSDGQIVAISVEVGGFLGIFEREVVLKLDQVGVQADRQKLTISMTREEVEQLPVWNN